MLEIKGSYVTYISTTAFLTTLWGGYIRACGHRCEYGIVFYEKNGVRQIGISIKYLLKSTSP